MNSFKISCAGFVIEIFCKQISTKKHCLEYIVEDEAVADFSVCPEDKDYDLIRSYLKDENEEEIELAVISYLLSDAIVKLSSVVMHGAAISYDGEGIIFTAPSGVGKTTQARLWKKVFGEKVTYVNGDKPIISVRDDKVFVSGSPFCGKEGYSENKTVPLKAICFIERGEKNSIEKISSGEVLNRFFAQLFIPRIGSEYMSDALKLADSIVKNTEFYILKCNITEDAPRVAYNGIFEKTED